MGEAKSTHHRHDLLGTLRFTQPYMKKLLRCPETLLFRWFNHLRVNQDILYDHVS